MMMDGYVTDILDRFLLANIGDRHSAFVLIDLNKVLLLEPVSRDVLSNLVLPMVLHEWVQTVVR
jgi:hypothetical protein